mmetsp:Transcript_38369/g.93203  ORF Transcript_38369/g.93203 Transcript_38369/m.93203 type:complete len:275 (+) Transcript_38369:3363-4187(+)
MGRGIQCPWLQRRQLGMDFQPMPALAPPPSPDVLPQSSCLTCTQCETGDACAGWCADSQLCMLGNGLGPTSGSCSLWIWLPDECPPEPSPTLPPPPLSPPPPFSPPTPLRPLPPLPPPSPLIPPVVQYPTRSCLECLNHWDSFHPNGGPNNNGFDLGWCAERTGCYAGTESGPSGITCVSWIFYQASCPPPSPQLPPQPPHPSPPPPSPPRIVFYYNARTCSDCINYGEDLYREGTSDAGWCGSLGQCYAGSVAGPRGIACPNASWVWYPGDCA